MFERTILKVEDAKRFDENGKIFLSWRDEHDDMIACATYVNGSWASCWIGNTHKWDIPTKI